jgi:hypothetical protein
MLPAFKFFQPTRPGLGRHALARVSLRGRLRSHPQHLQPARCVVTTNARVVAFLGTFACPAQQVWLPGNDLQDPSTWDAPGQRQGQTLSSATQEAQAELDAHFTATGIPSQQKNSDMFRLLRAAFYQSLKWKVGLAAAKAAALRINLNIEGCGHSRTPSPPNARSLSHSPSSPPPSFTQSPFPPRSLVRDGQTSLHKPRLVVSHRTCPPLSPSPPRERLCNRYCSNKQQHEP